LRVQFATKLQNTLLRSTSIAESPCPVKGYSVANSGIPVMDCGKLP
jgi:hypothetical protein